MRKIEKWDTKNKCKKYKIKKKRFLSNHNNYIKNNLSKNTRLFRHIIPKLWKPKIRQKFKGSKRTCHIQNNDKKISRFLIRNYIDLKIIIWYLQRIKGINNNNNNKERHTAPPQGRHTHNPLPQRGAGGLSAHVLWQLPQWPLCTWEGQRPGDPIPQLSSGHRTGKGQFSFQSQRKAKPKNAQTTAQLHSSHTLVK